jgi:hypothetical protein
MSLAGSAERSWRLTRLAHPWALVVTVPVALCLMAAWWAVIVVWRFVILGFWLWLKPGGTVNSAALNNIGRRLDRVGGHLEQRPPAPPA